MAYEGQPSVAVLGGGFAGLAAAQRLAEAGLSVRLYEKDRHLGGRASSFWDPTWGTELDNGLHVLLGCCTAVLALLSGSGLADAVSFQDRLSVPVLANGRWAILRSARLPGPLHLWPNLFGYGHLAPAERLALLRVVLAANRPAARGSTFATWLSQQGQSEAAQRQLWDLIAVSFLNAPSDDLDAETARRALKLGFLDGWRAARLGFFRLPLGQLAERIARRLVAIGVAFRRATVVRLERTEKGLLVRTREGEADVFPAVVAALPPDTLYRLLPPSLQHHPFFQPLADVAWSPIVNVYSLHAASLWPGTVALLNEGLLLAVANRGRLFGLPELDGRLLVTSVSAAEPLRTTPPADLARMVTERLSRHLAGGSLSPVQARVIWQQRATPRLDPRHVAGRLPQKTPFPGLYLAGDWTDTGWPPSLESAVRSGFAAAEALTRTLMGGAAEVRRFVGRSAVRTTAAMSP